MVRQPVGSAQFSSPKDSCWSSNSRANGERIALDLSFESTCAETRRAVRGARGIIPFHQQLMEFRLAQQWYLRDRPVGVGHNALEQRMEVAEHLDDSPAVERW